jgi:hypothetical protein
MGAWNTAGGQRPRTAVAPRNRRIEKAILVFRFIHTIHQAIKHLVQSGSPAKAGAHGRSGSRPSPGKRGAGVSCTIRMVLGTIRVGCEPDGFTGRRALQSCVAPGRAQPAGHADCRSFLWRNIRLPRAREAERDQDQVVEMPGIGAWDTGDYRTTQADRRRFPASARLQGKRAFNVDS